MPSIESLNCDCLDVHTTNPDKYTDTAIRLFAASAPPEYFSYVRTTGMTNLLVCAYALVGD